MDKEDATERLVNGIKANGHDPESNSAGETKTDVKPSGIRLYTGSTFKKRGRRRKYIIPGWLPAHGFTAINAKRGTGKSAIMFDLMMRVSHGMDWDGLPVKAGYVPVYLCGEDDEGLEVSMTAWDIHHGKVGETPLVEPIIADGVPNLSSWSQTEALAAEIRELVGPEAKCIVFLDTWQRSTSRAKQNADDEMQTCIEHAEQLAVMLGGPLVAAFHPPKDGRNTILGHSVIENSSTAIWQVTEDKTIPLRIKLEVTRIKGSGRYNHRSVEFQVVNTGLTNEFGTPEDAVVPRYVAGNPVAEDPRLAEAQNILGAGGNPMSLKALSTMVARTLNENPETVRTHFRNNCPGLDTYYDEKAKKYRDPMAAIEKDLDIPM
jgi:hypothetical protein